MATRLAKTVRDFASWLAALLLVGSCVGGLYFFLRADEDLRRRVENTIGEQFPRHSVIVSSARYVSGEGIHLRGVSVVETDSFGIPREPELTCKEAVLHCNLSLEQILNGRVEVHRVDIHGLSVRAFRDQNGIWNLSKLRPKSQQAASLPTIHIEDSRFEVVAEDSASVLAIGVPKAALLPSVEGGRRSYNFEVKGHSSLFSHLETRGWFNASTLEWCIEKGKIRDLDVRPEFARFLPPEMRRDLSDLVSLRARLQVDDFGIWKAPRERPRFWVRGALAQGRLEHPKLPHAIDELAIASMRWANYGPQAGWQVADVDAKFGTAKFHLKHAEGPSIATIDQLGVVGNVTGLTLSPALRALLPAKQQRLWDKYQPQGLVDALFRIQRSNDRWRVHTDTTFRDVSLLCTYFEYPVVHSSGRISFRQDETLDVDLWAAIDNSGRQPLKIDATIQKPGPQFHGTIDIRSDWLPWDERINRALPGSAKKLVRNLNAQGEVTFHAHLTREPNCLLEKDIKINVRRASVRYQKFAYPLQDVQGHIHVTDELWKFAGFEGHNDSCTVQCDGTWRPLAVNQVDGSKGGQTQLLVVAREIPCDNELRNALPPGPQQIWKSLRPRGSIDRVQIDLVHRTGMPKPKIDVLVDQRAEDVDPDRRGLEIQPTWFPLRMHGVTGVVDYKSDGTFQLHDLRAEHGRRQHPFVLQVPDSRSTETFLPGGSGVFRTDGSWDIQLHRILADGVETTPEVIAAIPPTLASGLRKLQFSGKLSFEGQMRFARGHGENAVTQSAWSSRVNVDNGNLRLGNEPISNIFGEVLVTGRRDTRGWNSTGRVHFDSLNCRGIYWEDLDTPWEMDEQELRFGDEVVLANGARTAQHLTASVFHGDLQADGAIGLSADNPFRIKLALTDFDAAKITRDLTMPSKITGRGLARLNLTGSAEGTHTLRGRGTIELDDAKLAKLPAIIEILNNLKVRNAPPDVFSSSRISFDISGDYLNLRQFDLHGESLSLKGKGWLAFDRRLDVAFYSILGGEKSWRKSIIPMLGQASQQLLQIRVQGSLDQPEWSRRVLPGLNELFLEQPRAANSGRRRR